MSKYYKTKDVYEAVGRAFVSDKLADREVTLVTDELADLPTIEVSEDAISVDHTAKVERAISWLMQSGIQATFHDKDTKRAVNDLIHAFKNAPSVVPSRPKGEWRTNDNTYAGSMQKNWKCTNCCDGLYDFVCTSSQKPKWNFCPNCGADMRGDE